MSTNKGADNAAMKKLYKTPPSSLKEPDIRPSSRDIHTEKNLKKYSFN